MTFNPFKRKIRHISGALPDDRSREEREKDFLTEEIVSMAPVLNWPDYNAWKSRSSIIKMLSDIEVNSQGNVGSCAAQALSLLLAIKNYQEDGIFNKVSAKPIYANRRNEPSAGMYADDIGNIGVNLGSTFESLYPSPNDTDANMSNLDDYITAYQSMAKVLRMKKYIWIQPSIDNFAQILSMNQPIVMTVIFGDGEWSSIPEIKNVVPKYGHMITALENSWFTYQSQKSIYVQDSHGKDRYIKGRHILTEEWFTKGRVICGIWFTDMNNLAVFNDQTGKIKYQWTKDLYVGCVGEDVNKLQLALATIKDDDGYLFPLATQSATNYFGGITRQAVKRFQKKYNIEPVLGYCGPKTRSQLNKIFI